MAKEDFPLDQKDNTQENKDTPKSGAQANKNTRDRSIELPADHVSDELEDRREAANNTADQTIDEGNDSEVQGKLAIPHAKVMKRGQTMWTDGDGQVHKELNDAEPNAKLADASEPDYIRLHEEVINGADPLKATADFKPSKEDVKEGNLKNAELHPRTMGVNEAQAEKQSER